jgi:hypothetical protein
VGNVLGELFIEGKLVDSLVNSIDLSELDDFIFQLTIVLLHPLELFEEETFVLLQLGLLLLDFFHLLSLPFSLI